LFKLEKLLCEDVIW